MLSRSERHWQILVAEYKACRQKLQSKREGHKILLNMLSEKEEERNQLQKKLASLWKVADEILSKSDASHNFSKLHVPKDGHVTVQGLILLVTKLRTDVQTTTEQANELQTENSDLKKDIKALRSDKTGFNRVVSPTLHNPDKCREDFLAMIQSLKQEVDTCNTKIKTLNDEATDFRIEREFYKQKLKSVTEQLLEKNECQPIADIETLLEENRVLRDKVDKLQHINAALVAHNTSPARLDKHGISVHTRGSYPGSAIKKRKGKTSTLLGRQSRGKHVTFGEAADEPCYEPRYESQYSFVRSLKEKVRIESELHHLQTLIIDMQKVSNGLAETVLDKNTALKHQRASNRLLGERVYELEAKLRALEMSGFWNVPEGFTEPAEEDSKREVLRRLTISGEVQGNVGEEGEEETLLLDHLGPARSGNSSSTSNRSSVISPEVNLLLDTREEEKEEHCALLPPSEEKFCGFGDEEKYGGVGDDEYSSLLEPGSACHEAGAAGNPVTCRDMLSCQRNVSSSLHHMKSDDLVDLLPVKEQGI